MRNKIEEILNWEPFTWTKNTGFPLLIGIMLFFELTGSLAKKTNVESLYSAHTIVYAAFMLFVLYLFGKMLLDRINDKSGRDFLEH